MPSLFNRVATWTLVLVASVLLHLMLLGVIVLAERRHLPPSDNQAIEVELIQPPEMPEPQKEEPKPEPPKPEVQKPAEQPPSDAVAQAQSAAEQARAALAALEKLQKIDQPPEKVAKPEGPSGGTPSENPAKLTPEEIAAFRSQVQKCWTLPIGLPNAMKLEAILRVSLGRNGSLVGNPELLKANASAEGPVLVGIAMKALQECGPYRSLPAAKYSEWKLLDLRFLATGLVGLGSGTGKSKS